MPTETKHEEIAELLNMVQSKICDLPCARIEGGKECSARWEDKRDAEGRSLFWYGIDCKVPAKHFCDTCAAYWLASVARNLIYSDLRWTLRAKAEAQP